MADTSPPLGLWLIFSHPGRAVPLIQPLDLLDLFLHSMSKDSGKRGREGGARTWGRGLRAACVRVPEAPPPPLPRPLLLPPPPRRARARAAAERREEEVEEAPGRGVSAGHEWGGAGWPHLGGLFTAARESGAVAGGLAGGRGRGWRPEPATPADRGGPAGPADRAQGAGRGRGRVSAPAPRCCPRDRGSAVPSVRPLPLPPSADTSASQSAASRVPALPALCLLRLAMCSLLQRCSPLWFLLPPLNFVIVEATCGVSVTLVQLPCLFKFWDDCVHYQRLDVFRNLLTELSGSVPCLIYVHLMSF
ncbi:uncharacterized protein LOC121437817 [Microtus oregoni]|uniref:uncharacterized protein LOC121434094 n=1 Tax=Microtus oregoni TaxID=111838 RepID=UPI001BB28B44|nr:uncharacterized protein LOC121434094 [Microtus oregoni]XP_041493807.1 uncharacterized protein LOC121437817 [Microtus oregoni]